MAKSRIGLFMFIFILFPVALYAGLWKTHAPFRDVDCIAETRGRIYFTSLASLFAYDKENDETIVFSKNNGLNGVGVVGIFVSPDTDSRMAIIAYHGGNIDILFDNGKIINLPDIGQSSLDSREINHISFNPGGKEMLVATTFGAVLFNLSKWEVSSSLILRRNVEFSFFIGEAPFIVSSGNVYRLHEDSGFSKSENWEICGTGNFISVLSSEENTVALCPDSRAMAIGYDNMAGKFTYTTLAEDVKAISRCLDTATPFVLMKNGSAVFLDKQNNLTAGMQCPPGIESAPVSFSHRSGNFTSGAAGAITFYEIIDGVPAETVRIKPGNLSVGSIKMLRRGSTGNLYISNRGNSNVFGTKTTAHQAFQSILTPTGEFRDITPMGLSVTSSLNKNPDGVLFDPTFIREDPEDPSIFYIGNITEGFYALDNNSAKELAHFGSGNTPMTDYWGIRAMDIAFDANGNLWLVTEREPELPSIMMLPGDIKRREMTTIDTTDWIVADNTGGFKTGRDAMAETSPDGRYIYFMGEFDMLIYDTAGTTSTVDDHAEHAATFRLADGGGYIEAARLNRITVDKTDGSLWIATSRGVLVAKKPQNAKGGEIEVIRPVIARDDGSGLADYLLATQCVYDIAIDGAGHKWLATESSGVYVTNQNGTEILDNYTTSNSGLPSNTVYAVDCDPAGNGTVYFGTDYGLVEYDSEITAGTDSYNNVKIYPNPVRPDYHGDIRIDGLIDGSLIKILDSGGEIVTELHSEGGTVIWNATGNGGRRIAAGVYHVFASSPQGAGGPIGKIIVIR